MERGDPGWPESLADLPDPPPRLRVEGALPDSTRAVAVVGTRHASEEAVLFTRRLAADLAAAGCVIVSGGATGIDAAAHEGALAAGCPTVAVLGSGLDRPYPVRHRGLFSRIAQHGALLSEHPDAVPPLPWQFLERNRLIAALAKVVVVAQAPARSGALSTAAWAKKLGRPLLSVPAAPWDERGAGCIRLLSEGHGICTSARSVLSVPALGGAGLAPNEAGDKLVSYNFDALNGDERAVLGAMRMEALHPDDIGGRACLPARRVQQALFVLQMRSLVEERSGGRYAASRAVKRG